MKTLYNQCVCCGEKWQVIGRDSHLDWGDLHLDEVDQHNLKEHGQLYSQCEDCTGEESIPFLMK